MTYSCNDISLTLSQELCNSYLFFHRYLENMTSINFFLALAIALSVNSQAKAATPPDNCFANIDVIRGGECLDPNSIRIVFKNICSDTMHMKWCLERPDGSWNCGFLFDLKPDQTTGSAVWECSGTGKYKVWGRTPWSGTPFPEIHGLFRRSGNDIFALAYGENEQNACERARDAAKYDGACECETVNQKGKHRCRVQIHSDRKDLPRGIVPFRSSEFSQHKHEAMSTPTFTPNTPPIQGDNN